jgi:hypothetical protein
MSFSKSQSFNRLTKDEKIEKNLNFNTGSELYSNKNKNALNSLRQSVDKQKNLKEYVSSSTSTSTFIQERVPTLTLPEELNNLYRYIYSLSEKRKQSYTNIEAIFSDPENVREIHEDLERLVKKRDWEKKYHDKLVQKLKKDLYDIDKTYDNTLNENYKLLADRQQFDLKIIKMERSIQDLSHSNEIKLDEISLLKKKYVEQVEKLQHSNETLMKQNSGLIIEQKTHYMENSYLRTQLLKSNNDFEKLSISLSDKDKEINEMKSMNKELLFKSRPFSPVSDMSDDDNMSIDNIRIIELSPKAKPFEPFVSKNYR